VVQIRKTVLRVVVHTSSAKESELQTVHGEQMVSVETPQGVDRYVFTEQVLQGEQTVSIDPEQWENSKCVKGQIWHPTQVVSAPVEEQGWKAYSLARQAVQGLQTASALVVQAWAKYWLGEHGVHIVHWVFEKAEQGVET